MKISKNNSHFFPSGVVYIIGGTMRPGRVRGEKIEIRLHILSRKVV